MRALVAATCVAILAAGLSGCQSDYQRTVNQIRDDSFNRELKKLESVSFAEKKNSEARGTKSCHVKQWQSAYLARKRIDTVTRTVSHYSSDMSDVFVRVYANGRVGIAVTEDTYPGTNAYFLIAGKRYSADGDSYASLDSHALDALKRDEVIKFSWTNWPYRNEVNREDVLAGFKQAYDDCLGFLRT